MPSPSPLFVAAIEADAALDRLDDKLRNVRRPLTKSEKYAVKLVLGKFDLVPGLGARIMRRLTK